MDAARTVNRAQPDAHYHRGPGLNVGVTKRGKGLQASAYGGPAGSGNGLMHSCRLIHADMPANRSASTQCTERERKTYCAVGQEPVLPTGFAARDRLVRAVLLRSRLAKPAGPAQHACQGGTIVAAGHGLSSAPRRPADLGRAVSNGRLEELAASAGRVSSLRLVRHQPSPPHVLACLAVDIRHIRAVTRDRHEVAGRATSTAKPPSQCPASALGSLLTGSPPPPARPPAAGSRRAAEAPARRPAG